MVWVETDRKLLRWVDLVACLAFVLGLIVWGFSDFATGFAVYLLVGLGIATVIVVGVMVREWWLLLRLPAEARQGARVVLAWFREEFPEERIDSVAVRAIEPTQYVISIRHGMGRPTPRRYFAITRPDLTDITELPRAEWWPRGLL
jgi:hypothetical protein